MFHTKAKIVFLAQAVSSQNYQSLANTDTMTQFLFNTMEAIDFF